MNCYDQPVGFWLSVLVHPIHGRIRDFILICPFAFDRRAYRNVGKVSVHPVSGP